MTKINVNVIPCLDCKKLLTCPLFRARYERKKAAIQDERYEQAIAMAERTEVKQFTMLQIEKLSLPLKEHFIKNGKLDVQALRVALTDEYGLRLSNNKGYELKAMLLKHYPNILEI